MKWLKAFGWVGWVVVVVIFVQNALASSVELEPRAALISWIIVALLILPMSLILIRQHRRKRKS